MLAALRNRGSSWLALWGAGALLAGAGGCQVDVPELDAGPFACTTNDDCSEGFSCVQRSCVSVDKDTIKDRCGLRDWICDQGDCIDAAARCDGHSDCADGSDERDCVSDQPCNAAGACPPDSWTCNTEAYGTDDGCDCECGVRDPDCDDPSQSLWNCGEGESCSAAGRCVLLSTVPADWSCDASFYDASDGCDCECGAYDLDCDVPGQILLNCEEGQVCGNDGLCHVPPATPPGWSCGTSYYDADDGCDCECGAYDPDCGDPARDILNCGEGELCDDFGQCVPAFTAPPEWSCYGGFYDAMDGCDCECGAYDPDCSSPTQRVYNCGANDLCDPSGLCAPTPPFPPEWTCEGASYDTGDGCHCECGTYDPDCSDSPRLAFGCGPEQACSNSGTCVNVPPGWDCFGDYFGTSDGCDCDCGAYDPDCDDGAQQIWGCPAGYVCDLTGQCAAPSVAPQDWECDTDYYGTSDGCDCLCGAYDPDCADPDQEVLDCDIEQTCSESSTCIPVSWVCGDTYAVFDGCDCDCGVYDPDCDDSRATLYNCSDGQTCSPAGVCEDDPTDSDGDAVPDVTDNCPAWPNGDQADADANGVGSVCDPEESTCSLMEEPGEPNETSALATKLAVGRIGMAGALCATHDLYVATVDHPGTYDVQAMAMDTNDLMVAIWGRPPTVAEVIARATSSDSDAVVGGEIGFNDDFGSPGALGGGCEPDDPGNTRNACVQLALAAGTYYILVTPYDSPPSNDGKLYLVKLSPP